MYLFQLHFNSHNKVSYHCFPIFFKKYHAQWKAKSLPTISYHMDLNPQHIPVNGYAYASALHANTQRRECANSNTVFYTLTRSHCVLLAGFEGRLEWIFISSLVFVPDAYINFCPFCFSYDLRLQGARSYAFLPVLNSSAQRLSSSKCHRLETGVEFFWFVLLCYSLSLCLTFSLLPSCFEIQNVVFVSYCSRGNSFLQSTRCGVCLRISLRKLRMERNDAIKATMEGKGQGKEKEKATKI